MNYCKFCQNEIDTTFDDTLEVKGVTYYFCSNVDCRTLNTFQGEYFIFKGGTSINRYRGLKCVLDTQFITDPSLFLVDFLNGTKEICHIDNLEREIETDL